jgi:hypothetical protein
MIEMNVIIKCNLFQHVFLEKCAFSWDILLRDI